MIDYKPHLESEPPNYGRPNRIGMFFEKYDELVSGGLAFLFIVTICALTVLFFDESNKTPDMGGNEILVSSKITYNDIYGEFALADKWKQLNPEAKKLLDPEVKRILDSLYQAELLIMTNKVTEERKKQIQDSILREAQIRDSIAAELVKQDSANLELAKENKVKITYTAIIDDGITRRTVDVNSISDTITPNMVKRFGNAFQEISIEAAHDRQQEIDKNPDYYKNSRIGNTEAML